MPRPNSRPSAHRLVRCTAVLPLLAAALCSGALRPASPARAAPTVVTMLALADQVPEMQKIAAQFHTLHPDIAVSIQGVPFDALFQQNQVRLSSGASSPDVVQVDAPVVASYAVQGFLAPLDAAFSKDDLAQFVPASLQSSYYLKHLLATPLNSSGQALYYNKDLLAAAGVPFPANDVKQRLTWERLATLARKAQVTTGGKVSAWGLVIDQIERPYQLLPLPESLGGKPISADGLHTTGVINSAPWVKAFTYYYDLFNTLGVSPKSATDAETANLFQAGHAAFFWGGPWWAPYFLSAKKLHFGYAPSPYFAGGRPVTPNDSWHLGVNRHSANFAAAAAFVRYITVGPGNDRWAADGGNFQVPSLTREIQKTLTDPSFATFPNSLARLTAQEAQDTAIPRPITPGYGEYQDILTAAFNNIRTGQKPQAALDDAAAKIDRALQKYRNAPH